MKPFRTVTIKIPFLLPEERAKHLPIDTAQLPMMMLIKGRVVEERLGTTTILTATGREVKGMLHEESPSYTHGFGHYVSALEEVKAIIKKEAEGL